MQYCRLSIAHQGRQRRTKTGKDWAETNEVAMKETRGLEETREREVGKEVMGNKSRIILGIYPCDNKGTRWGEKVRYLSHFVHDLLVCQNIRNSRLPFWNYRYVNL